MLAMFMLILASAAAIAAKPTTCECESEYQAFRTQFSRDNNDRCHIFCDNLRLINDHNNNPESTYTIRVRKFHDLTREERRAALSLPCYNGERDRTSDEKYPGFADLGVTEVDWNLQDHVTTVRDQADCGDCWAESATALIEAAYSLDYGNFNHGDLTHLSVQQVAECTPQFLNRGCEGGWPIDALRYINNASAICTEQDYPTLIGDGTDRDCNQSIIKEFQQPVNLGTVTAVPQGNETGLRVAAQRGLVSVAVDASGLGFSGFHNGVYNGLINGTADCNKNSLDHAIVVTGLAVYKQSNTPFYIVRNSWGTSYGLDGYLFMKQGINVCGIAQDAVHVSL